MTISLTASTAWKLMIPSRIQRVLPFTVAPSPGTNTASSKSTENAIIGRLIRSKKATGITLNVNASPTPMAIKTRWRNR